MSANDRLRDFRAILSWTSARTNSTSAPSAASSAASESPASCRRPATTSRAPSFAKVRAAGDFMLQSGCDGQASEFDGCRPSQACRNVEGNFLLSQLAGTSCPYASQTAFVERCRSHSKGGARWARPSPTSEIHVQEHLAIRCRVLSTSARRSCLIGSMGRRAIRTTTPKPRAL